ncbi:MAG: hypothetical protein ACI9U2_004323 [Bradymonadia bacterium]|jgi:hypothetical protein
MAAIRLPEPEGRPYGASPAGLPTAKVGEQLVFY